MNLPRFACTAASLCALLTVVPPAPAQDLGAVVAGLAKRFKQLDTDGDGKLSAEEAKPVSIWLQGADADGDGFITADEARNHLRTHLAELIEAKRGIVPSD